MMESSAIRVVSLFSGCGGTDLGFEGGFTYLSKRYPRTRFKTVWANDINEFACETFRKYFGDVIKCSDVTRTDFKKIPDCDVILGGFPCQDFSVIWKRRGINSDRGSLYRFFAESVKAKRPKVFLAENVKGLLSANGGGAIMQICRDFHELGYRLYVDCYNFADYGLPQLRERVLITGVREDIKQDFVKPEPVCTAQSYRTASEALEGVRKVKANNEPLRILERTKKFIALIPEGGNFKDVDVDHELYVKGMISHVYRRLHSKKPATTIIAGGGGGTWGYHHSEPRPLTNRERARLQGFPDSFEFVGSITEVRRQIGNAVPPAGIYPFARQIERLFFLGEQPKIVNNRLSSFRYRYPAGQLLFKELAPAL